MVPLNIGVEIAGSVSSLGSPRMSHMQAMHQQGASVDLTAACSSDGFAGALQQPLAQEQIWQHEFPTQRACGANVRHPGTPELQRVQRQQPAWHEDEELATASAKWLASTSRSETTDMLSRLLARPAFASLAPVAGRACDGSAAAHSAAAAATGVGSGRPSGAAGHAVGVAAASAAAPIEQLVARPAPPATELRASVQSWPGAPPTTIMVHNIPSEGIAQRLLEVWPLDGSYDLLFVPTSAGGRRAVGYAFLNFVSPERASAFTQRWHGQRLPWLGKCRKLKVAIAHTQGLEANVRQLKAKGSPTPTQQSGMIILKHGRLVGLDDF